MSKVVHVEQAGARAVTLAGRLFSSANLREVMYGLKVPKRSVVSTHQLMAAFLVKSSWCQL